MSGTIHTVFVCGNLYDVLFDGFADLRIVYHYDLILVMHLPIAAADR